MLVVRILERKNVIRFFGVALMLAPFINIFLHMLVIKMQGGVAWSQFQFWAVIKGTQTISIVFAICSIAIGTTLLSGSTKAWKFVLLLVGTHLLVQILNINDKAWKGPLAWPSFLLNAGIFFFIFDQLVWKVKAEAVPASQPNVMNFPPPVEAPVLKKEKQVIHLKSYRKILFNFGSDEPWGEMKTLSSEFISVQSFAHPPENIDKLTVQINFTKDVVIDIEFDRNEGDIYYFRPLNMNKDNVTKLNKWLKKIAV